MSNTLNMASYQNSLDLGVSTNKFNIFTPESPHALVFIDSKVNNYQSLLAGIKPGEEVYILDDTRDGIAQISDVLAKYRQISSVHIVSHGTEGNVNLGATQLNSHNLESYAGLLQEWKKYLTVNADILLYGCDIAAGVDGDSFVNQFSALTGADVAASTNLTGNAVLGGDWNFEKKTGNIESGLAFNTDVINNYRDVLPAANCFPNALYAITAGQTATVGTTVTTVSNSVLYQINNLNSPSFTYTTNITPVPGGTLAFLSNAAARDATTGYIYYIENKTLSVAQIGYIDPANPATKGTLTTNITGLGSNNPTLIKLAQAADGSLYGMSSGDNNLYKIVINQIANTATFTVAATTISGNGFNGIGFGGDLAFDPTNSNRLYVTETNASNYYLWSIDVSNFALAPEFHGNYGAIAAGGGSGSLGFALDGKLFATGRPGATGTASNLYQLANYSTTVASGTSKTPTLIGPTTSATAAAFSDFASLPVQTPQINLNVQKTDGNDNISPGSSITYTITVVNQSSSNGCDAQGIQISDTSISSQIVGATWTRGITSSQSSPTGIKTGTGDVNDVVDLLQVGETVTYSLSQINEVSCH